MVSAPPALAVSILVPVVATPGDALPDGKIEIVLVSIAHTNNIATLPIFHPADSNPPVPVGVEARNRVPIRDRARRLVRAERATELHNLSA